MPSLVFMALVLVAVLDAAQPAQPAHAESPTFPDRPDGVNVFFVDEASLITPATEARINAISKSLLQDKKAPIIVVTITSLKDHLASGSSIESYATQLFNSWGIGTRSENLGILLLVSRDDRRARIELGLGWGRSHDAAAQNVMDHEIIPRFQETLYSDGILAGVQGLDRMARGLPSSPTYSQPDGNGGGLSATAIFIIAGLVLFGVAVAVSVGKSGTEGWGWTALKVMGSIVVFILIASLWVARVAAFAGGVSGGGGASGSW